MSSLQTTATRTSPLPIMGSDADEKLIDNFGRVHRSMRISVTDKCNIRCRYCMPATKVHFLPDDHLLSFSQIAEVVRSTAGLGIENYRLTGGEPLVRPGLDELIGRLCVIPGVRDVALTTNGMLLADQLEGLVRAGLQRINISLDTLSEKTFQQLSRRTGLYRVLQGIEAALAQPKIQLRLNALILRNLNLDDVVQLVQFARSRAVTIRFIEFMPLDAERDWNLQNVVSGAELRALLASAIGPLQQVSGVDPSQPSTDYQFADGSRVGFIDTVTQPFCGQCDRVRLTADGKLRNCLFGRQEWDVAGLFRIADSSSVTLNGKLKSLLRECIAAKAHSHGIHHANFTPPDRSMFQIGG